MHTMLCAESQEQEKVSASIRRATEPTSEVTDLRSRVKLLEDDLALYTSARQQGAENDAFTAPRGSEMQASAEVDALQADLR